MSFIELLPLLLFAAMSLVMCGLGLSLSVADFARLRHHPRAVALALLLQTLVLPAVCFGLIVALDVPPTYAIGLMLLAASPGGISANLFSHAFGGNVALNISLTGINTLLSIVTWPLITNWAIGHFAGATGVAPLQLGKLLNVLAVVFFPVALGMWIKVKAPAFGRRMERPMKLFNIAVLAALAGAAVVKEWATVSSSFASLGPAVVAFNILSLAAGYALPRLAGLDKPLATAISFEVGIHSSAVAMFMAMSVLNNFQLALPAALYSVTMYPLAGLFGWFFLQRGRAAVPQFHPRHP